MDINTILAEPAPPAVNATEPPVGVPRARPKIRLLTRYGAASPDNLAVFAAAKVFLDSAIYAAPRTTDHRGVRAGPKAGPAWHYNVRFTTSSRIQTHEVDVDFEAASPLLGTKSHGELHPDEHAEFPDRKKARTKYVITVRLAAKQDRNMPVSQEDAPKRSTFEFRVVNGSVTHCVWRRPAERHRKVGPLALVRGARACPHPNEIH
jgi:hypothetical protein